MKNVRFGLMILLILSVSLAQAQKKKYKLDGNKFPLVEISDPGEVYSTYVLQDSEIELLKIEKIKPYLLDIIINNHTEAQWPQEMGNLDSRVSNPDKIKSYTAYKVCKFDKKYLLVIPAKYNKDMGAGWAPSKDMFIVVGESGLKE